MKKLFSFRKHKIFYFISALVVITCTIVTSVALFFTMGNKNSFYAQPPNNVGYRKKSLQSLRFDFTNKNNAYSLYLSAYNQLANYACVQLEEIVESSNYNQRNEFFADRINISYQTKTTETKNINNYFINLKNKQSFINELIPLKTKLIAKINILPSSNLFKPGLYCYEHD